MASDVYFAIGDGDSRVEIINTTRTEAYAEAARIPWFKPVYNSELIPSLLGQPAYETPQIDEAPWYDDDDPASNEFFGFYPTGISGLEDSTRESDVMESTLDGGIPGRLRYNTKTAVFTGVLVALSARGAEYGFRWLARATARRACSPGKANFNGEALHYLSTDPSQQPDCQEWVLATRYLVDGGTPAETGTLILDGGTPSTTGTLLFDGGTPSETGGLHLDPEYPFVAPEPYSPALSTYWRSLRKFKINNGPKVLAKRTTSDGAAVWQVQMTGVAGMPFEFGAPLSVLEGFGDPAHAANPYAAGITPGIFDVVGDDHFDAPCAEPIWTPIYNPDCTPVVDPPTVPVVDADCYTPLTTWWRRFAQLPAALVPLWGDVVPVVSLHVTGEPLTMFRMRFYPDFLGTGSADDFPCDFIADLIVTYVPTDTTLVFDGVAEAVYVVDDDGNQRRADSLIMQTDGSPFVWPLLTCGYGYIVTFDQPSFITHQPVIDLALVPRATA